MTFRLALIWLVLFVSSALPLQLVWAKQPAGTAHVSSATVTSDMLEAKLKEAEATADLDAAVKSKLVELYRQALSNLESERSHLAAAKEFEQAIATAADQAAVIRERISEASGLSPSDRLPADESTPLAEVEQLLLKTKADLAAVEAKLAQLEGEIVVESGRPDLVRQRLTAARQQMEKLSKEAELPVAADQPPRLIEAGRWRMQTQVQALVAEINMLDKELLSQPMRMDLLKVQRDKEAHSVDYVGTQVQLLEELVNQRRRVQAQEAEAHAEAVRQEALGKHPLVQDLADRNAALSEELQILTTKLEAIVFEDDALNKQAARIEASFRNAQQKVEVAGLSEALGRVLLEQRRTLPDPQQFRKALRKREHQIADASLRQISHQEEHEQLRNLSEYVDRLGIDTEGADHQRLRAELVPLAKQRRELLDKALAADEAYLRNLLELDSAQRRLLKAVKDYHDLLVEHLLWIRSHPAIDLATLARVPEQLLHLMSASAWRGVGATLLERGVESPVLAAAGVILLVMTVVRQRLRMRLKYLGKRVGLPNIDRFYYTLRALLLTLVLAAPWPLLTFLAGWQLSLGTEVIEFTRAVSTSLLWVAPTFYFMLAFLMLCRPGGLAAAHFQWPESTLKHLRRELRRLMLLFLPISFLTLVAINQNSLELGGGVGRLGFVCMMLAVAWFMYRLFSRRRGVLASFYTRNPNSLLTRMKRVWLVLGVVLPLSFMVMTLVGYMYSAAVWTTKLMDSMALILVLFIIQQLAMRLLLLTRRRLILRSIRERREGLESEGRSGKHGPLGDQGALGEVEEPEVDLVALSEESCKLLNTALVVTAMVGLWWIWSEVLPAFRILDEVTLWQQKGLVGGEEKLLPVTLADLGLAVIVLMVTLVVVRSVPALLEIILLQRLDMSPGSRYAVTTLSGYMFGAIGLLIAFNVFGADWSQIQWLVAALGVGIGFGLQEIVANFISGLIILFERPIRVGDVVTVGDTDGVVTRIRIRATTIRNWDRKELLVPNKEFITGRLLNWSLSDDTTRIMFQIGLAYGSDVQRAMALIAEAAEEHEQVLEDPKPFVAFEGFGDNALTMTLRCYVGSVDYRIATTSELHQAINEKFNAAGIVIAFPQVDVHLDMQRPLEVRLQPGQGTL